MKNLITAPSVKYRRPYDVYIEEYPHLASFMASVNGNDFLTDPTGSRRFLPFEVLSIDIDRAIWVDMDRVYYEARTLLHNGFRYWFDDIEIEELHRGNTAFHVQTIEYEMLLKGFEKPPEHAVTDCFLTTVETVSYTHLVEELHKIYGTNLMRHPQLAVQRDIFVFQCLIGCRVGDLLKMTKSNLIDGAIEYIPRKRCV